VQHVRDWQDAALAALRTLEGFASAWVRDTDNPRKLDTPGRLAFLATVAERAVAALRGELKEARVLHGNWQRVAQAHESTLTAIVAALEPHIGELVPVPAEIGGRPLAERLALRAAALLRHNGFAPGRRESERPAPIALTNVFRATGGVAERTEFTSPEDPGTSVEVLPTIGEVAKHMTDLHDRLGKQQAQADDRRSLAERIIRLERFAADLAEQAGLTRDASLEEIRKAVSTNHLLVRAYTAESERDALLVELAETRAVLPDREGAAGLEALAAEIPAGFKVVEPSRPGRWAIGDRFEVFESSKSLADAIRMCRDTLAHRRAPIG
jgi:hypothetical protein